MDGYTGGPVGSQLVFSIIKPGEWSDSYPGSDGVGSLSPVKTLPALLTNMRAHFCHEEKPRDDQTKEQPVDVELPRSSPQNQLFQIPLH